MFPAADFANPLVLPGSSGPGSTIACPDPPSEDSVATIVSMGFSRDQAMKALRATVRGTSDIRAQGFSQEREFPSSLSSFSFQNNSLERAVDWIFSHIDDLDAEAAMDISEGRSAAESISESVPVGPKVRDGPGSEFQARGMWILGCKLNIFLLFLIHAVLRVLAAAAIAELVWL